MERVLLNRPIPHTHESLTSYIARLALSNHYPSPSWVHGLMSAPFQFARLDAGVDDVSLVDLAKLCGVSPERLSLLVLDRRFADLLNGQEPDIQASSISLFKVGANRKVCPACLLEEKHLRMSWLIKAVTACPKHRCLLIDTCSCNRRLKYPNVMSKCICGVSADGIAGSPVSEEGLSHTRYIEGLLGFLDHSTTNTLPAPFSEVHPKDTLVLLECLHRWLAGFAVDSSNPYAMEIGLGPWTRSQRLTALPNSLNHVLYATAFSILKDWPSGFHKLLIKQRETVGSRSLRYSNGISAEFPVLLAQMTRYLPTGRYQFVYDAFHDYLGSEWDGGYVGRISSISAERVEAARQRFVGQWGAAKMLGVALTRVKDLVASGALSARIWESRRKQNMLISRQDCLGLVGGWKQSLSEAEACKRLGVARSTLRLLADTGVLETIKNPKQKVGVQFESDVLENLIRRLRNLSSLGVGEQPGRWMALNELGPSLCDLLNDIFDGRVRIFESEGQGLAAFRFSINDVRRIRSAKRQTDRGYTRKEAAVLLGIPLVLLKKAIDADLLRPKVEGASGQFISRTDLEAFQGDYVDFHQALQLLGVAQVTLKRWLRKGVLVPVLSTDRRFRKHLFRLPEVVALRENPVDSVSVHNTDACFAAKRKAGTKRRAVLSLEAEIQPNTLISTAQACRFLKVSPAWLAKRTREGKIAPVAGPKINGEKASAYRFGDVTLLAEMWPPKLPTCKARAPAGTGILDKPQDPSNGDHLLSVAEAAELLGITHKRLRAMVYDGTIPVALQEWPSGYLYFDKRTIEGRVSRHLSVTSSEAAGMLGIPVHVLNRWRKRGRIEAIEGPEVNGVGWYRYRRADVEALMDKLPTDEETIPGK